MKMTLKEFIKTYEQEALNLRNSGSTENGNKDACCAMGIFRVIEGLKDLMNETPIRVTAESYTEQSKHPHPYERTDPYKGCAKCGYGPGAAFHNRPQGTADIRLCEDCGATDHVEGNEFCRVSYPKQTIDAAYIKPAKYGEVGYRRAMPGRYDVMYIDGGCCAKLYWVAEDSDSWDEDADFVCDLVNIEKESAENIISILNEGLALIVERDNQPVMPEPAKPHVLLPFSDPQRWDFRPVFNKWSTRPFGIELYDRNYPEQGAKWNIWMFTDRDRDTQLELFIGDPLGYIRAIEEFESESQE